MSLDFMVDKLDRWRAHPAAMVRELFNVEPDAWQLVVLEEFAHRPMQAMLACKGPGKTAVLAWLCWNFLLTRMHPKIGAVSITGKNLHDNLWPEMAKWQKVSPLLDQLFEWGSERIYLRQHPETWFMSAKTWPQSADEQALGETLAGMWANHVMFVLDEAGGIPVPVMRTAEAALQREGTEGHIVLAGNTTSTEGCLYEAAVRRRHLWAVYEITADPDDPKRTPRISIEYARQQIAEYGRDDPWVMVNILARFPSQGINQLVSPEQVRECFGRHIHQHAYEWAPKIMGGDVARFGDDKSILFPRQGLVGYQPTVIRNRDTVQVAGQWSHTASQWGAHSLQIDATGGYGAGVIDVMRTLGWHPLEVQFAGKARDPKFANKRAEIWWEMCEWIKSGASLPEIPEMVHGLSSATYSFKKDQIIIEPKELMKARLGRSPDHEDALACTFAHTVVVPVDTRRQLFPFDNALGVGKARTDYDPLERA